MTTESITIPGVQKARFTVTIVGETPLLCNRFSDFEKEKVREKQQKKPQRAKEAKDPEACYERSLYRSGNGDYAFPASGIKKACVSACRNVDGIPMTLARGIMYVMGDLVPIRGEPRMREDVVRLQGKTIDLRYRAEFPEWEMDLEIQHNPTLISRESIVNLLENAGFSVGIGDWRPEKNGTFGMFHVKRT